MSGGETSGVDLARVALRAAMKAARKNGSGQKAKQKQRPVRTVRRDGREPMGLGAAIGALVTELAVSYDPDSGRLTVCPESAAWATKARLEQTRVIAAANEAAGRAVVRALRILPPGAVPAPSPADVAPEMPADAPTGPVRTRETACEGYRRALAAHQQVAVPSRVDPGIAEAVERQTAAMRELSRRRVSEADVVAPDDALASIEATRAQRRRQAAATEAAALRRARSEKAGCCPKGLRLRWAGRRRSGQEGRARRIPPGPALLPYALRPARVVIVGWKEVQWLTCWPCHLAEVPRCNGASCVLRCVSGPLDLRLSCTRAHAHVGTSPSMEGIIDLHKEL
uniref:TRA3 protein n=1 Tax=Streptomyces prasinus TaxID=67345 RepID=Q53800_9ACTN|nr:TRA3 [Streptomyces prasinus]